MIFMKTTILTVVAGLMLAGHVHAQSQLLQLTPVEQDVADLRADMNSNMYYLGLTIAQINRTWGNVWAKDTARLEAFLNALGAEKVAQLIGAQAATAEKFNELLEATGSTGARVVAVPGRDFTVDQTTGYITVVPIEADEEEPAE
jgi:sulfite reductase beta subunit-like hemoprotein